MCQKLSVISTTVSAITNIPGIDTFLDAGYISMATFQFVLRAVEADIGYG